MMPVRVAPLVLPLSGFINVRLPSSRRNEAMGSLNEVKQLAEEANRLANEKRFADSAKIWDKLLSFSRRELGAENLVTAEILNNLGFLYNAQGLFKQAERVLKQALAIREKILGPEHPDTTQSLNNLAGAYIDERRYSQAESILKRALEIRERTLGSFHTDTAESLKNLAFLYGSQGLHSQSEPLYIQALHVYEQALGTDSLDSSDTLDNLAEDYIRQGRYSHAEIALVRILSIKDKALGSDHPGTAQSLSNLAYLYEIQGLYSQAEDYYNRAFAIREKTLGADHPETATSLNNLAVLHMKQGLYNKAEPLYKRALAIRINILGSNHAATAQSLNNLATYLYEVKGLYTQAEALHKQALLIREKVLGYDHPETAESLNNLAFLYSTRGLNSRAEPLYKKALSINEKVLGVDDPETARTLNNLAFLYNSLGLYGQAELLYKRALSIREKVLGDVHVDTANCLGNLALLYQVQGLFRQAEPLFSRALAIKEQVLGSDHPDTAKSLNNLAGMYHELGLYSKAESLYQRALAIYEQALGEDHLDAINSRNNLAIIYWSQGKLDLAIDMLSYGITLETKWLIREGQCRPQDERLALRHPLGNAWEATYSLAEQNVSGSAKLALSTRLHRHGLMLEIEQVQARLTRASRSVQKLAQQRALLNSRIGYLHLPNEYRIALLQRRSDLEQELFHLLPDLEIPLISPEQIGAILPIDSALLEFQRFRPLLGVTDPTKRWGPERYLVLILFPDSSIQTLDLGEAEIIEKAVARAVNTSAEAHADAAEHWAHVSRLVIAPLLPHLLGIRQWFLSPDEELHRVPFAALQLSNKVGDFLASSVQLRLINTGRDLMRFQTPAPTGTDPLVMANPNYERGTLSSETIVASAPAQKPVAELGTMAWQPLPATAKEGEQIGYLLAATPITRDSATVALLQRAMGPRVLHIASHGFFLGDQELSPEDPLLRSGIVLAGANNPGIDSNDDGILTALEATALQLDGTELVVLSGCSTAQGDLHTGEGLYGLQRALTVAGARSTLLSLWKVDDAATAEFMVRFYRRLKAGEGRADALAAVQAEFRAGEVKGPAGEDWSGPFYWAAWQLVGDWRPIEGL